jgi:hypothetical protein
MTVTIDGTDAKEITIDDKKVSEITMDGDVVWQGYDETQTYYSALSGGGEVKEVDTDGLWKWTASVNSPGAVAIAPNNEVAVTDDNGNWYRYFSSNGTEKWAYDYGDYPMGVDLDESYVYVVGDSGGYITVLNRSDGSVYTSGFGARGTDIRVNANGYIFVLDSGDGSMYKYDRDGNYQDRWNAVSGGYKPFDIAETGNEYWIGDDVNDSGNDAAVLRKFTEGTEDWQTELVAENSVEINGVCIDPNDNAFVQYIDGGGFSDGAALAKIDSTGGIVWTQNLSGYLGGNLGLRPTEVWGHDGNGTIHIYDHSGNKLREFDGPWQICAYPRYNGFPGTW